jgi:1-acyl-sn-glycerol-3-phosphate acyltransferase
MKKLKDIALRVLVLGVVGTIGGLCLCLLELFRCIRFYHYDRFPLWRGQVIVVASHPSTKETYLIPLMFFPWWFSKLLKPYPMPISTPDKKNFSYFRLIKEYFIFIDRGEEKSYKRGKALMKLKEYLDRGASIVLFPEGTRTDNAKGFVWSKQGVRMGMPQPGVSRLVKKTGAPVLPIWVDVSWKCPTDGNISFLGRTWHMPFLLQITVDLLSLPFSRTRINTGNILKFSKENSEEEINKKIVEVMLDLADELVKNRKR